MNVEINGLAKAVMDQVEYYKAMLNENVADVFDEVADEGLNEIKAVSRAGGNGTVKFNDRKYSKGWVKVVKKNKVTGSYGIVLHNKKYYRLTHLLEKEHALRNGDRSTAYPHIAPTQDKMDKIIVKRLKEALEE